MSPQTFQAELRKIAKDLVVLFDPSTERFWVVQQRASYSGLVMPDGATSLNFYKLFPIQTSDGSFRQPDERDLKMALEGVMEGHEMWKDCDKYMRNMKIKEQASTQKQKANSLAMIEEVTKELKNASKIKIYTGR